MSTTLLLSIVLFICAIIISFLIKEIIAAKNRIAASTAEATEATIRTQEATKQVLSHKEEATAYRDENNRLREENGRLRERIYIIENEKERISKESEIRFQNLANEILANNSRLFKEQNESRLAEILAPLKENIEQFKKAIYDSYSNEARERFSLQEKIKELIELNQTIGQEAKDLTNALKGNCKIQGDWGEMILENILEKSGLEKGREYTIQQTTNNDGKTIRNEQGSALRPDVIVYYPGEKYVVIDSKVSLNAFINYANADNQAEQEEFAKQHLASVRRHINELHCRKYQDYVGDGKTDFVMMFIPNEAAYITAMQLDSRLWQDAYDARVLLVSPTQLISALRLISQLWSHDKQTRNAIEIANAGGRMYDKLAGFIEDMRLVETRIEQAREAHCNAMKKLCQGKGNLLSHADKMRALGAKASKSLPQAEE